MALLHLFSAYFDIFHSRHASSKLQIQRGIFIGAAADGQL